ncbi:MAG TPA: hypothetical protein DEB24_02715 [Coriobacteriia bacterium]|nr:hypothetical protein [Coriobacteriia bacterium]
MSSLKENVTKNITTAISLSGYKKVEIARLLGVSKAAITNWTRGDNLPDIEMLAKMSKLFNIPLSAIIGSDTSHAISAQEQSLISSFRKLNELGRQRLLEDAQDYTERERFCL